MKYPLVFIHLWDEHFSYTKFYRFGFLKGITCLEALLAWVSFLIREKTGAFRERPQHQIEID